MSPRLQFNISMLLVLMCALAVVFTSFHHRQLARQWQVLGESHNALQEEYGRLMLEYSTLAAPSRVESFARQKLNMQFPDKSNTRIIQFSNE